MQASSTKWKRNRHIDGHFVHSKKGRFFLASVWRAKDKPGYEWAIFSKETYKAEYEPSNAHPQRNLSIAKLLASKCLEDMDAEQLTINLERKFMSW